MKHREGEDPYIGRVWIDWAYAQGCMDALGDTEARPLFDKVLELAKGRKSMRGALITQFRMGQLHERARQ